MGDCDFSLSISVMNKCSEQKKRANPLIKEYDGPASGTRKLIECAFGMLKGKFPVLKYGIRMLHDNDISFFVMACVVLQNKCIREGKKEILLSDGEESDGDYKEDVMTTERIAGKRKRNALLYYLIEKRRT